jgi:hypothetical protein
MLAAEKFYAQVPNNWKLLSFQTKTKNVVPYSN